MKLKFSIVLVSVILVFLFCSNQTASTTVQRAQRIISFAPSITETLYALALDSHIVGVTDFCTYPVAVQTIPSVGGYTNPNYEMIIRQKPDLVILLKEHTTLFPFLNSRKIPYITIDNHSIEGIAESFRLMGAATGNEIRGDSLALHILSIKRKIEAFENAPAVLLIVGRDKVGSGTIGKVYAAGRSTFYSELLHFAGAKNAIEESSLDYPTLSVEALLRMNPDIIIDLAATYSDIDSNAAKADWSSLHSISAVKTASIYCPVHTYLTIPGPRIDSTFLTFKAIVMDYNAK